MFGGKRSVSGDGDPRGMSDSRSHFGSASCYVTGVLAPRESRPEPDGPQVGLVDDLA
ncbi:hypothetical protein GCM10022247_33540 [Allokutzneria multivorans]|uniref:Uncharacterized protein n=1 Tax=Allokutzneria multivorans TaxID=1142134 RepID=A0ABP7S9G1_9PSEU